MRLFTKSKLSITTTHRTFDNFSPVTRFKSSLILNAHSVTTLRCKSYSGCFVLSFLKVQCPFYLWLIRTTVLQRYLALIPTRIFIITATSSHWLIIVKLCSVLYYQVRLDNGVSMVALILTLVCRKLTTSGLIFLL